MTYLGQGHTLNCVAAYLSLAVVMPAFAVDFRTLGGAYPRYGYDNCIEGSVYVEFAVRTDGSAEDIHVLASEPAGVFDDASVEAVAKSRFETDASATAESRQRHTLELDWHFDGVECSPSFDDPCRRRESVVGESSILRTEPVYPVAALANGTEGYVIVSFARLPDGRIVEPTVVEADPPGVFDSAALAAVRHWRAKPRVIDGKAVRVDDERSIVRFCRPDHNARADR